MANPVELPFAVQAGESSVRQNSQEKLINMYADMEVSGRKRMVRRQRAGLTQLLANSGEKRAIERYKGIDYVVIDDTFYSFNGTSLTTLGTLSSRSGRCWIIFNDNGNAMISDGSTGYNWDGSALTTITTPDSVPVGTLAYQGGFGIFNVPDSGQFYITGLNDFTSVDALDFATAEAFPDNLLRVFVNHNQLLLCGSESIEVWSLSGGTDFPFSALPNQQIERGIIAPNAIVAEDNTVAIVGDDRVVYRVDGYVPVRISTGPIERALLAVSDAAIALTEMFAYTAGGQKFITIRCPGELTVQFNLSTQFWNYCQTYGYSDWQILGSAGMRNSRFLTPTGIVKLDESVNTDEAGIMLRKAVSAPGDANGQRISINSFMLDAEVGRAPAGGSADVMFRFAPDGESFGNIRVRSLGETGNFLQRPTWRDVGQGRKPAVEVSISDDVRFAVMATYVEAEVDAD